MTLPDAKMEQYYYEDLNVGYSFDYPAQTITRTHFQLFSAITGDFHPSHSDKNYAKNQPYFKENISHGFLNTILTALGASNISPHIRDSVGPFLSQKSSFLNPVYIGDTLYPYAEVSDKKLTSSGEKGIITFDSSIYNQNNEKILEGQLKYMFYLDDG